MRDLTGAPGYSYNIEKTKEPLERLLVQWDKMNYIMSVGLGEITSQADKVKALGLIPEHSYSII